MRTALVCLLIVLLATSLCFGALSNNTAWECRPTVGASTNGGGFVTGATGTDMSLFNNKNATACSSCQSSTVNISTTDAVANGTTTITSATANFSSAIVGNILYFTGGTGSIAAVRREVVTFTNSTTIVLDAAIASSTGMTMNIGGALDVPATALLFNTAFNTIWVKATGTISRSSSMALNNSQNPAAPTMYNRLFGYQTTRGDSLPPGQGYTGPTIQATAGTIALIDGSNNDGWWVDGFILDCNGQTDSEALAFRNKSLVTNTKFTNCKNYLYSSFGNGNTIMNNEFTVCTGCTHAMKPSASGLADNIRYNVFHDLAPTTACVQVPDASSFINNIIDTCTGAAVDGVTFNIEIAIEHNILYNIGRDGLVAGSAHIAEGTTVQNNVVDTVGRYCFNNSGGAVGALPQYDGNAFNGCTTANRNNLDATGGSSAYTNIHDRSLSVSPFIDAANQNFNLNTTAGGGAAIIGFGLPISMPVVTGTGYNDMGVFHSQFGTGGAGGGNVGVVQ